MSVYLYKPPMWRNPVQFEKSALVAGVMTSTVVYRISNAWYNIQSPGMDDPDVTACDVDSATGLRLYFDKPMVVPGSLYTELSAITKGDTSWTDASLTLL